MKFKLLLLIFTLSAFSINVFATTSVDSVGVENHNGKRVILFKIKKKDTYYAIGRRYHVNPKEIMEYNDNAKMTIGHTIKVPTDKPFKQPKHEKEVADKKKKKKGKHDKAEEKQPQEQPEVAVQRPAPPVQQPQQPQAQPVDNTPPTQYKVSPKETLFSIAKRFNTTVDDIMKLNNLQSNTIQPGQILNVKANTPVSTPAPTSSPVSQTTDSAVTKARFNSNGFYTR